VSDDRVKVNAISNEKLVEVTKPENKVIVTDKKQDTSVNVVQKETSVVTIISKPQGGIGLSNAQNKVIVTDKKQDTFLITEKETSVVTIGAKGPKGDKGNQGDKGDKGDPGTLELNSLNGEIIITGSLLVSGSTGQNVTINQNLIVSGTITSPGLSLSRISTGSVTASVNVGNDTFRIQSGSSTFLFVSSSGRVGIGTSTPTNTLQVGGGITATSFTGSFSGSFRAPGSNNQIIINSNGVLGATSDISVNTAGVSNLLTANAASITNTLHVVGQNTSNNPTLIVGDGSDNAIYYAIIPKIFTSKTLTKAYSIEQIEVGGKSIASFGIVEKQAGEDPNSEQATKTSILSLTEDKRVGIGTTSPEKTLDVIGSVRISGGNTLENIGPAIFSGSITQPINNTSSLGILNVKSTSVLDGTVGVGTSLGGSKLRVKGTGASSATTALRIENSNDTAAFVVLDNGTVGVGMSNPNPVYNIQTNGTAYFANTIYTGGGNISWNSIYGDGTTHTLSGRSVGFITDNNNPTLKMLIRSDGRIGVGTTSPIAKLHISGGVNERLFIISSSLGPSLFVSGSGNVGIGTTSPTERLHVDGNLLVTGRITAEEFHTSLVSASIVYQSGSTQFGDTLDDTHIFTGSLRVNGSITGSLFGTSSWAQNVLTASFALNVDGGFY
jgi:hypothetical protein